MNRVLVIGGTGTVGRHVLSQLSAKGAPVRALTRNPDASRFPPHIQAVCGDLTLPETLDSCLNGIDTVFLVWTAPPTAAAPALERIATQIRAGDLVRWPHLSAPTAPIDPRDIARIAVHTLCEDGHGGADYVLTGPESLTQFEQLSTIGRVLGRSLRIEEILPDEAHRELLNIMPAPVIKMLLNAWAAAIGQPAFVTSTVADITGIPARPFADWVTDHSAEFRA